MTLLKGILPLYKRFETLPFGKYIFTQIFCFQAPYFRTIFPNVLNLKRGFAQVSMKQRWSVQNHIQTVHAIAVCNLVEMCMGLIAEASIPSHLRWLPCGMDIDYLKKAVGTLVATSNIDPDNFFELKQYPGQVLLPVEVSNSDGVVVTRANVRFYAVILQHM